MSHPVVNLSEICWPKQWKTISASALLEEGFPVYGANGKIGFFSEFTHENPTLMITCRGATCGNVHISEPKSYINGNAMALDDLDHSKVDIRYLYYFFKKRGFSDVISGSAQPQITRQGLTKVTVPLPSLKEQQRIAAILDKADVIRRKRQQAIALADEFLRAVFLDMFGDPNANPQNVEVLPMTEIFNIKTGSLNSNAAVESGKYPFFTCAKEIYAIDDFAFDQESLLLAGNNAQADYDVKHYKGKFNAYQRTYVLSLKDESWSYPFYKFALEYQLSNLKRFSKGSNTKYITMEIMSRTLLPVPEPDKQKGFVEFFEKISSIRSSQNSGILQDVELAESTSQKAFSGRL
ncbi:restriction endonuclease subunit S [Microbulbifer taiwanensis]|uniref:Restriction endonuclease subunit S n=1 Tax=Microbulbifer taiwanensis TaxID=986746 RepID=A0ABW1YJ27_9GAMM|nr:restriction endonuclease subunit S [Microbulbifer taiwanensis]